MCSSTLLEKLLLQPTIHSKTTGIRAHPGKDFFMAQTAKIVIHPSFQIGDISPRLFSTFLEPIGTMVNGTMYNPKHPTANALGFRQDVIDALKVTDMPAIRLPGGNFVSGWQWKDSIGPKSERKVHLDPAWYQYITNEVGHDEYLQWAEAVQAESLYTINLGMGTGTVRDAMDIVEYTNHPGGSYWSDLRRKNGHEDPYGVKIWYLGNEMDGPWQLGSWDKNPKGYGILANETSKVMKWIDPTIKTAVCGSSAPFMDHFPQWEEEVLQECYDSVDYLSIHHYHSAPEGDYRCLLGGSHYYEDFIDTEAALIDVIQSKMRSDKKMMISFDEYGAMIRPNSPYVPGLGRYALYKTHYAFHPDRKYILHDPNNMQERLFPGGDMIRALSMASIQLAFVRRADKVGIGCMTGGLAALCASNRDHVWKAASYYIYEDLIHLCKGTSLQISTECETFDMPGYVIDNTSQYRGREGVPYVDAAAAWDPGSRKLAVFVINRNVDASYPLTLDLTGFSGLSFLQHTELFCKDLELSNSYDAPDNIVPRVNEASSFQNSMLTASLQPLSWNVFTLQG